MVRHGRLQEKVMNKNRIPHDFHDFVLNMTKKQGENGYPPEAFGRDYWLSPKINCIENIARVDKDYSQLLTYFNTLHSYIPVEKTIIDIGAGAGATVNCLRNGLWYAEGCEYSQTGREIASEQFNITLKGCDLMQNLPYKTDQFNFGCCIGVLSMIPQQYLKNALSEIFRIVRYGVLLNVVTHITYDTKKYKICNPHHITGLKTYEWWMLLHNLNVYDWTSILPPQKRYYGIGVLTEFAGLFSKHPWEYI